MRAERIYAIMNFIAIISYIAVMIIIVNVIIMKDAHILALTGSS